MSNHKHFPLKFLVIITLFMFLLSGVQSVGAQRDISENTPRKVFSKFSTLSQVTSANNLYLPWGYSEVGFRSSGYHEGGAIDFVIGRTVADRPNASVVAAHDGIVKYVYDVNTGPCPTCAWYSANFVVIDHENGQYAWYLHLAKGILVHAGDRVQMGQPIGKQGNTGIVAGKNGGYHVHFFVANTYKENGTCVKKDNKGNCIVRLPAYPNQKTGWVIPKLEFMLNYDANGNPINKDALQITNLYSSLKNNEIHTCLSYPGQSSTAGIIVFTNPNCLDKQGSVIGNTALINLDTKYNDKISSIITPQRWSTLVYENQNADGGANCVNQTVSNLSKIKFAGINTSLSKSISSMRVMPNAVCGVEISLVYMPLESGPQTSFCLDVPDGSKTGGIDLQLWECTSINQKNRMWSIVPQSPGFYSLKSVQSSLWVGWTKKILSNTYVLAQFPGPVITRWHFRFINPVNGVVQIDDASKCWERKPNTLVGLNGGEIYLKECNSTSGVQKWRLRNYVQSADTPTSTPTSLVCRANSASADCGPTNTPVPATITPTGTATPTAIISVTPTLTRTPTSTVSGSGTDTPTPTSTGTATITPTGSATPDAITNTPTATGTPTETPVSPTPTPIILEAALTPAYGTCSGSAWVRVTGGYNSTFQYIYITLNTNVLANSTNSGKWTPDLPVPGQYKVEAFVAFHNQITWPCAPGGTIGYDTSDARYKVYAGGTLQQTVSVDQKPLNNQWANLGTYSFPAGTNSYVILTDYNGETQLTRTITFNVLRFTYVGP
jgi:murein DD-endopeptidase MepM/ murein hydrolase activator NlpD